MRKLPELRVLSLGWGVQSWCLAAMMALDELPRVDVLIHADTRHERFETYAFVRRWSPWLGEHGLNVVQVTGRRTDVIQAWSNSKSVMIPAFTVDSVTGKRGMVLRQCTTEWKIKPIRRWIRVELRRRQVPIVPGVVESLQGISLDEFERMRDSDAKYITNCYPLVDLGMTRADCETWLRDHALGVPPKSSCTFCPYRSIQSWRDLEAEDGPDWREALQVDATIRDRRPKAALFVHPRRKPLAEAVAVNGRHPGLELPAEQPCDSGHCWT